MHSYIHVFLLLCLGKASIVAAQPIVYPFGAAQQTTLPALSAKTFQTAERRFSIHNPTSHPASVVVEVLNLPDSIRLYQEQGNRLKLLDLTGQLTATVARPVGPIPYFQDKNIVLLTVPPNQMTTYRLQAINTTRVYSKTFPIRVYTSAAYRFAEASRLVASDYKQRLIGAFFWGIVTIMCLFVSLQYALLREKLFGYYALYLLMVGVRALLPNDFIVLDDWPGLRHIGFVGRFSMTAVFWSFSAYLFFVRAYVGLATRAPRLDLLFRWLAWGLMGLGIMDFFVTMQRLYMPFWIMTYHLIEFGLLGIGLFNLWVLWKLYDQTVKYLFWGITSFMLAGAVSLLNQRYMDADDVQFREVMIWITGYSLEILAFSMGLVKRQQLVVQEKIQMQAALIEQLNDNQRKQNQLLQIRHSIARDLHDELGSELSGISILSGIAAQQLTHKPVQAQTTLSKIGETARSIMERMQDIVWSLPLGHRASHDLTGLLEELTTDMLVHTACKPTMDFPPDLPTAIFSPEQWRNFLLIYKESLHNVIKHAKAEYVLIQLTINQQELTLVMEDTGIGFVRAHIQSGNGLRNLQQRADALGGQLFIDSKLGIGTRLTVIIPLLAAQAADALTVAQTPARMQ